MIHKQKDLVSDVTPIMKEAGNILLSFYHKRLTWKEKGNDNGFVTEADIASEQYLIKNLTPLIPGASFFAEESGKNGDNDYCWVIDPLDGTTNFAHNLPYFCISVALTYKKVPVFGMIYQPLLNELFYAQEGKGAFLNDVPLNLLSRPFDKSIIAIGLPYAKNASYAYIMENTWTISREAYAIRHFGAVALDIAYVAAGRLDGAIFSDLGWWDVAAGMAILKEAGGMSTDFEGKVVGPDYQSYIGAGNFQVHERLMALLKPGSSI